MTTVKYDTNGALTLTPRQIKNWNRKIAKGSTGECWIWTGFVDEEGYGWFFVGDVRCRAHRVSYRVNKGTIPDGMCVCHTCDNPPCVNPDHLWIGTSNDNTQDMVDKGRQATGIKITANRRPASGDKNGSRTHPEKLKRGNENINRINPPKLSMEKAQQIRTKIASGVNFRVLAKEYEVHLTTIYDIDQFKTWDYRK